MNSVENPQLFRQQNQQNQQQLALKEPETAQNRKRHLEPELLQPGSSYKHELLFAEKGKWPRCGKGAKWRGGESFPATVGPDERLVCVPGLPFPLRTGLSH